MAEPTTPEEVIERLNAAAEAADDNNLILQHFIQGDATEEVVLEDGTIPTLRGVIEEMRNQAGQRRMVFTYSVNDLTRYEMKAEPLFGALLGEAVKVDKALALSLFRLNVAPTAQVSFEILAGGTRFDVVFNAGQTVGTVVNPSADIVSFPRGTNIEVYLTGYARSSSQLRMSLEFLIDYPA